MLTEVKNQIKIIFLSLKYNIMRQMINKVSFITNILFMILNNASFIIQWIILFSIKSEIGGYTLREVVLLWGFASSTYGIAHILFYKVFSLSDLIINGKLDSFLVQPKNVFLSVITSDTSISAIGDLIYGYICLCVYGLSLRNFILFTIFSITGAIIISAFISILHSLSFWIVKIDILADSLYNAMTHFATYPGNIFKSSIQILLYTILPIGVSNYLAIDLIISFNIRSVIYILAFTVIIVNLAVLIFNKGLKRYSSTNLMSSRI